MEKPFNPTEEIITEKETTKLVLDAIIKKITKLQDPSLAFDKYFLLEENIADAKKAGNNVKEAEDLLSAIKQKIVTGESSDDEENLLDR